jgi:CMP-N-acetylneuraminic acid synthetase
MRSQDLPRTCVDAGLFYMMNLDAIRRYENFIADKLLAYNVPADIAVDVDTPTDWEQLEILYQKQKRGE